MDPSAGPVVNPRFVVESPGNLIDILSIVHPKSKKNNLRRMIDRGRILVNGVRARRAKEEIPIGANIEILSKEEGDQKRSSMDGMLQSPEVLFEDEKVIVVDKPAGLLTVATPRGEPDTMFDRVSKWLSKKRRDRTFLVHRLDRETSGCLILAKSKEVRDFLQKQFKNRSVERIYHAVVFGNPSNESGVSTTRILETRDNRVRLVDDGRRAGKEAITNWKVEQKFAVNSLIRIKIETGRRAQIRLHMSEMGHPVVGDTRYGRGKASVNRLCLHASSIGFMHPDGSRIRVESEIPPKLFSELKRKSL